MFNSARLKSLLVTGLVLGKAPDWSSERTLQTAQFRRFLPTSLSAEIAAIAYQLAMRGEGLLQRLIGRGRAGEHVSDPFLIGN